MASAAALANIRDTERHLIGSVVGAEPGPTLVITGGIHGNEPAGVLAAERVLPRLQQFRAEIRGEIVFLRGNTRALKQKLRYVDVDFNRQWTSAIISENRSHLASTSESTEQQELLIDLSDAITRARGEIDFLDLHTTSADGEPFATVGDTMRNRRFALMFPVTIVLGLEEQIEGTLLEYLNNLGAITLGFEAGQHEALSSVDHHEAMIWNAVVATGNLAREQVADLEHWRTVLRRAGRGSRVVEVRYRHSISPADNFRMEPGFRSFEPITRGELLATDVSGNVTAREGGLILMPLYQRLGDDGFFLAREVKRFWLKLSAFLRRFRIGNYMRMLPGVRRDSRNKDVLVINTQIARLLPLQIFHLLGFRKLRWVDNYLVVSRRAYDLVGPREMKLG
ncbi:MAG TPA: succinylglutamate desuccinylase/aspartoacylase family protein [Pyrinomonadaceae bacterium]|nr:succinylglutamate desuccinylase/aspartoacylase family protein [Pyrinomonadaceae bacterium]